MHEIRINYLKKFFVFDCIAALPGLITAESEAVNFVKLARFVHYNRLFMQLTLAPGHIPVIRLIDLRSAFAPLSVGTPTCADTKSKRTAASAKATSGTKSADRIRFGSSNAAPIAAGV